jgi:hypothetical protein
MPVQTGVHLLSTFFAHQSETLDSGVRRNDGKKE